MDATGYTIETVREMSYEVQDAAQSLFCTITDVRPAGDHVLIDVLTSEWDTAESLQGWIRDEVYSGRVWVC